MTTKPLLHKILHVLFLFGFTYQSMVLGSSRDHRLFRIQGGYRNYIRVDLGSLFQVSHRGLPLSKKIYAFQKNPR